MREESTMKALVEGTTAAKAGVVVEFTNEDNVLVVRGKRRLKLKNRCVNARAVRSKPARWYVEYGRTKSPPCCKQRRK